MVSSEAITKLHTLTQAFPCHRHTCWAGYDSRDLGTGFHSRHLSQKAAWGHRPK